MNASTDHVRPPLLQDRSFWGLNLTQFFGAFNDNLFKQLVMLSLLDQARQGGKDLQGLGLILFAVPFILISGYAGFLSDRFRKRTIIVACKVAEVLIILLGMIGFWLHSLPFLLMVLCLMGVHSAFFGPSKYGILPEMLRNEDLPRA
ncbi:MAG: MFS transporter, partial [Planctomycetota bacterium]